LGVLNGLDEEFPCCRLIQLPSNRRTKTSAITAASRNPNRFRVTSVMGALLPSQTRNPSGDDLE
jgi:hypothetical protein